ncbi:MAG: phosphoribulokinase, partial [Aestuariibacter sp.]|nr:phosphoribulokinase [Aestuariibacter sp.]
MSKQHPIVAVTGSSGAGTSTVKRAFEHIFYRDGVTAGIIEGDSLHRYDRQAMREAVTEASSRGESLSHFGSSGNLFDELEQLFRSYASHGQAKRRYYLHSEEEAT